MRVLFYIVFAFITAYPYVLYMQSLVSREIDNRASFLSLEFRRLEASLVVNSTVTEEGPHIREQVRNEKKGFIETEKKERKKKEIANKRVNPLLKVTQSSSPPPSVLVKEHLVNSSSTTPSPFPPQPTPPHSPPRTLPPQFQSFSYSSLLGDMVEHTLRKDEWEAGNSISIPKNSVGGYIDYFFPPSELRLQPKLWPAIWKENQTVVLRKMKGNRVYEHSLDYKSPYKEYRNNANFTVVAVAMYNRLFMIKEWLRRWKGNYVFVLYTSQYDEEAVISFLNQRLFPQRFVLLWYMVHSVSRKLDFPINKLRNIGINNVETSHYIVLDMDMWPACNLYRELIELPKQLLRNPYSATIVPVLFYDENYLINHCETLGECIRLGRDYFPRTMDDVKTCLSYHICRYNKDRLFTHTYTNHVWLSYALKASPVVKVKCVYDDKQEPYYLLKRDKRTPLFDERFVNYGYNKVQHMDMLKAMNYNFTILTHSFMIDMPHHFSRLKAQYLVTRNNNGSMMVLYQEYRRELYKKYGSQTSLPICASLYKMFQTYQ